MVVRVVDKPNKRLFNIWHKPVKKETAVTSKLRIVFDASASPSQCLETGPSLQNLSRNVLVHNHLKLVGLTANISQAFRLVRISLRTGMHYDSTRSRTRTLPLLNWSLEIYLSSLWSGSVAILTGILLGVGSPIMLVGKLLYHEVCEKHLPLDVKLPDRIGQEWVKFSRNLTEEPLEVQGAGQRSPFTGIWWHK